MNELNFPDRIFCLAIFFGILLFEALALFFSPLLFGVALAVSFLSLIAIALLWRQGLRTLRLSSQLHALAKSEPGIWERTHRPVLQQFGAAIEQQFETWQLSAPEKEVALNLLAGQDLREIAATRQCSEREAQALSAAVYAKSGLAGRRAVASYFLPFTKSLIKSDDIT